MVFDNFCRGFSQVGVQVSELIDFLFVGVAVVEDVWSE